MRNTGFVGTILILGLLGAAPLQSQSAFTFNRSDSPAIGAPRSVVSADFNRDGFPDVALGGISRASIGILFNRGRAAAADGQLFAPMREIVVGGGPFELAAADLNRDGFVDIAVANADRDAVTILLNDARHEFASVTHVPVAQNPRGLAIADFNRDGIPDIIVTKYLGTSVDILFGAGNGTFPTRRSHPAAANVQGVAAADLNRDGWIDAAVVSASGVVSIYTMNSGGLAHRRDVRRPFGWNVVTTGDFNEDGTIDVAYASTASSVVDVMYLTRAGAPFFTGDPYAVALSPRGIEAADMNQDGALDLVVAGRSASTVSVLLRNRAATTHAELYARRDVAAGAGARDVALSDVNHDGRMDVSTANESGNSTTVLVNDTQFGPAAFRLDPFVLPFAGGTEVFGVADFDHNGKLDIVKPNFVLFDGTTPSRMLAQPRNNFARAGAVGDFNNDGNPDVAFSEFPGFRTYLGDGAGAFADGPTLGPTADPDLQVWQMRAADMNRDGRLDIVLLATDFHAAGAIQVYLGRGDGSFTRSVSGAVPDTVRGFDVGDLDRDGAQDAVVADQSGVHVLLGNGTGGWKSTSIFEQGVPRYGVAIGDVTHDGIPDLAMTDMTIFPWGVSWGTKVTVARGNGNGTFESLHQYDLAEPGVFTVVYSLLLADINADGQLDIFTTNGHFLPGTGDGDFGPAEPFSPFSVLVGFFAADFNRDGLVDLLGYSHPIDGNNIVMLNTRTPPSQNRLPVGITLPDRVQVPYGYALFAEEESEIDPGFTLSDPDLHGLRYQWSFADGTVVSRNKLWLPSSDIPNGSHQMTFRVDDYRGGVVSKAFTLAVMPRKENVIHPAYESILHGAWQRVEDETADDGLRVWHPNANAAKLQAPLANPTDYIDIGFLADPTQQYKLWIRLKAEGNYWGNDSVFVQFSGAKDAAGNPVYQIGTTSALSVNLEECANCGISGWGWEDDAWGAVNRNGVLLRFPEGGRQRLRIQTREDGVSIDQIVLSSETYRTTRPGAAKNDNTKLQITGPFMGTGWFEE